MDELRVLDAMIAERVMGYQRMVRRDDPRKRVVLRPPHAVNKRNDRPGYGWRYGVCWGDVWIGHQMPYYSTDIAAAWQVVERMVVRMGYDNPDFDWRGPLFKPEHRYLTNEGYPLGTTCWYVLLEQDGLRQYICAETAPLAICRAAIQAVATDEAAPDKES